MSKEVEYIKILMHLKAECKRCVPCKICEQKPDKNPFCSHCASCIEYEKALGWAINKLKKEDFYDNS